MGSWGGFSGPSGLVPTPPPPLSPNLLRLRATDLPLGTRCSHMATHSWPHSPHPVQPATSFPLSWGPGSRLDHLRRLLQGKNHHPPAPAASHGALKALLRPCPTRNEDSRTDKQGGLGLSSSAPSEPQPRRALAGAGFLCNEIGRAITKMRPSQEMDGPANWCLLMAGGSQAIASLGRTGCPSPGLWLLSLGLRALGLTQTTLTP